MIKNLPEITFGNFIQPTSFFLFSANLKNRIATFKICTKKKIMFVRKGAIATFETAFF